MLYAFLTVKLDRLMVTVFALVADQSEFCKYWGGKAQVRFFYISTHPYSFNASLFFGIEKEPVYIDKIVNSAPPLGGM